jgi:SAM-dependent methyltransferase
MSTPFLDTNTDNVDKSPAAPWLNSQWEFVRSHLPSAPARVVDLGSGPYGGFVPALQHDGHDALGVDPKAPEGVGYHRLPFEQFVPPWPADVVIACTSLHHTGDLAAVLDHVASTLRPGGLLLVIEWDWQRFDERTAGWCFDRLAPSAESNWLNHHRDRWQASGQAWESYINTWARREALHSGDVLLDAVTQRFDTQRPSYGPYFYSDLLGVSPEAETAAIAGGELRATRIQVTATNRS